MFSINFKSNHEAKCANQSKAVYRGERASGGSSSTSRCSPGPGPNRAAGSAGEQTPCERAVNLSVYAITAAASEAAGRAMTSPREEDGPHVASSNEALTDAVCLRPGAARGGGENPPGFHV